MDLFKILDSTPEPPIVSLATSENTSGDYWLAVPMCEYQKELTDQVVSLHYSDILKYFETEDKDQTLLDSLEVLYLNSQLVATHPYLLISHYLPKNLTAKDVPWNLCETSGKFQVLKDLIALMDDRALNIAVVSRSGKLLDLIEALLLGSKTNIKRHYGNYVKDPAKNKPKNLTTHIIPSDVEGFSLNEKFDLVIAFDLTCETGFLQSLKKIPTTPILRLVSANSIDHVALYFRQFNEVKSKDYLVDVTAAIVVLRERVGVLPPDLRPIYSKNLTYLKDWFQDFNNKPWPLPEMSKVNKYDASDVEKSLLSEVSYDKKQDNYKPKSYYELKRLQKDYTSNPLKDVNFGILSVNSNYNDSLTHKLIQNFNEVHHDLQLQLDEFDHFDQFKANEKDYVLMDETKLINEIDHLRARIEATNINSDKLTVRIDETRQKVLDLDKEVDELNTNEKLRKIEALKESILKEEQKKKALLTEEEYMSKEIENAKKSIEESTLEIANTKKSIAENELAMDNYWQDYTDDKIDDTELNELISKANQLRLSIEENLKKLNNNRNRNENRRISPSVK